MAAIAAARAQGVQVVFVTGRMYQSAAPYAAQLGLEGLPMATYNGAAIWDYPSARLLYHAPLSMEACKRLAAFCEARNLHLNAYVNDELYVADLGELTQQYVAVAGVQPHPVGSLFLWMTEPSTKMLIMAERDQVPSLKRELAELLGPEVNVTSSIATFVEITSQRATKGLALEWIANTMGFQREEVMAVGDSYNDLSMLQWAGTSFAMAGAPDDVKRAATHVTQAGSGLGVAEALERMGLVG